MSVSSLPWGVSGKVSGLFLVTHQFNVCCLLAATAVGTSSSGWWGGAFFRVTVAGCPALPSRACAQVETEWWPTTLGMLLRKESGPVDLHWYLSSLFLFICILSMWPKAQVRRKSLVPSDGSSTLVHAEMSPVTSLWPWASNSPSRVLFYFLKMMGSAMILEPWALCGYRALEMWLVQLRCIPRVQDTTGVEG